MKKLDRVALETLRDRLRAGDPAAASVSADATTDAERLRRRMLSEEREHAADRSRGRVRWLALSTAAAAVAVVVLAVTLLARHPEPVETVRTPAAREGLAVPVQARQMQFQTPGGTRIIWVVSDNLDL